ncbi:MAG TPA: Hsp70 family protein, partial [Mycobacterium sp.]
QLSAEVLKSLRSDVEQRTGELIRAAVITVPAAFDLSAYEATRRAAGLAGLEHAPLLPEPTAAALACGFQSEDANAMWLVYDIGGGTFDAAIVQIRDGEFNVINNRGDNFLGGKLIDWKIVEDLLIPAVAREGHLPDLARGDPRWRSVVNKLKLSAEAAKIQLSRTASAGILVDLDDGRGNRVEFDYELRRDQLDRIAEPFILRSINLCRKALRESRLDPGDIAKAILVGGPTLSPYLRARLADPDSGLGIPLDHSHDPLTVVVRGAAIFAGTQRMPQQVQPAPALGTFTLQLEYQPVGPDTEPPLVGRVVPPPGTDLTGYTVELANLDARPPWRSGKVPVTTGGVFVTSLWAERGRANTFTIELADATGTRRSRTPDRFTYIVGVVETQPPLTQSLGIGLQSNEVLWLVERGTPLPTRRRVPLRTAVPVRLGDDVGMIRIPILEGEHARADRNRCIGRLELHAGDLHRDVPEGSEVTLALEIDTSRILVAKAYVSLLEQEFEHVINLQTEEIPNSVALTRDRDAEHRRLDDVRRTNATNRLAMVDLLLGRIDDEGIVADIDSLLNAADLDAANSCAKRILDLRAAIDEVEDALEWPGLTKDAAEITALATRFVNEQGTALDHVMVDEHLTALRSAVDSYDPELLRQRISSMNGLLLRFRDRIGKHQLEIFDELTFVRNDMKDTARADRLFIQGRRAAAKHDFARLRSINQQLTELLPTSPPPAEPFSTVNRG